MLSSTTRHATAHATLHTTSHATLRTILRYLKGETHFFAAVVMLENRDQEKTLGYLEQAKANGTLTPESEAALELMASRAGLLELGVIRKKLPRSQLLQADNIDVDKLREMARTIATECGVPPTASFTDVNPVQLFDFSSLARCELPLKLLLPDGTVADSAAAAGASAAGAALVCPIGDALQEPLWTSGLGQCMLASSPRHTSPLLTIPLLSSPYLSSPHHTSPLLTYPPLPSPAHSCPTLPSPDLP